MRYFIALFIASLSLFAKPTVTVSILPQKYFVEQITHDLLDVNVMVQPGFSPHSYEPRPSHMSALASSDLYFTIGDTFEKVWLERFKQNAPNAQIIHTDAGITKLEIQEEHGDHNHHHDDPHIWLDPKLVKVQAKTIFHALVVRYPQYINEFTRNYNDFQAKLDKLDKEIETMLSLMTNRRFMVFHPSWGYFANSYHLKMYSIEVDGKEPKPKELAKILKEAKEHDIKKIFVSKNFSQRSANTIATELKADIIVIDELPYNWDEELLRVAELLQ